MPYGEYLYGYMILLRCMRLETRFCLIILVNVRKRHNIIDTCIPLQLCGCTYIVIIVWHKSVRTWC